MAENKIEQYTEEVKLNTQELDKNTKALEENTGAVNDNAKGIEEVKRKTDEAKTSAQQYTSSFEKMGATANTALGVLSASLGKTNPALASALGSVQKLIPNLVEVGNAAKKTGSLMKAAFSGAGLLTLITLVTTLVTNFDNIATSIGLSSEEITKFKTVAENVLNKVIGFLAGVGNAIVNYVTTPFKTLVAAFKKAIKGDFKGAFEEIKDGIKQQFNFKDAYNTGKDFGENLIEGARDRQNKKKAQEAFNELVSGLNDSLKDVLGDLDETFEDTADVFAGQLEDKSKTLIEWLTRNQSAMDKELSAINQKALQFKKDGVASDAEIEKWRQEELAKIRKKYADEQEKEKKEKDDKQREDDAKKIKENFEQVKEFASSMSAIYDSITDAIDKNLEAELKAGTISEAKYKKQKEALKAFSIAKIVADTAMGIASVWAAYAEKSVAEGGVTTPVNVALAAAQTAVQLASGIAGIASVNAESLSSQSTGSTASATAQTASYTAPQGYTLNVDANAIGESVASKLNGIQTVLVVDDVTKIQNQQKVVKANASF